MLLLLIFTSSIQAEYTPTQSNLDARESFMDAKFGLFIHWGIYSLLEDGEWVMHLRQIPSQQYELLPQHFNPQEFDPVAWVAMAKAAGMRYITITTKHHDGFALFDSKASDWNMVNRSPYKHDIIKMLADECHKQGLKFFIYYSHLDWHHPDYFPRGNTGRATGRPDAGDWDNYMTVMNNQLAELLTNNYGKIAGVWFDGWWDRPHADWRLEQTYNLIHTLCPHALIGNNRHLLPCEGEDFQMMEKDLPGYNTAGFNNEQAIGNLPIEVCETMNDSWGYNAQDTRYKSTRDLIHYLVRTAGYGANFLLNVGPMASGKVPDAFVARLEQMGHWLQTYGSTIYGTRKGPFSPRSWGAVTQNDTTIFAHILNYKDGDSLWMPITYPIKNVYYFNTTTPITYKTSENGLLLESLSIDETSYDTIVVIELEK